MKWKDKIKFLKKWEMKWKIVFWMRARNIIQEDKDR